jgi:pyruvate/2-oxoacid:ferredoxin oxidoreductase beta subunit
MDKQGFYCGCGAEMALKYDSLRGESVRVCPGCGNSLYWEDVIKTLGRDGLSGLAPSVRRDFDGEAPSGSWYRVYA